MTGDLGKHGQRDPIRVNILEAQELQAWCAEFGCTADQLKTAVGRAGVMAIDVRDWLRDQNWIPSPRRPRGWAARLLGRRQRSRRA
jgi:hypothetical protein